MPNGSNGFNKVLESLNEYSVLIVLVIFGSLAHVLVTIKQAREQKKRLAWIDLLASFGVSMFAGMIFVMTAQTAGAEGIQLGLAGSLGAYLGLTGLNSLADRFIETFTRKKE